MYLTDIHDATASSTSIERGLIFLKEEIKILQLRLDDMVIKNSGKEFLKHVEHFQNQFIVQINNVDELLHAYRENEHFMQQAVANSENIPVILLNRQEDLVGQFAVVKNIINDLRHEFKLFIGHWM